MRVVLYARVSTPGQEEKDLSIPAQIQAMESFCQRAGHQIVEVYRDGRTGRDDNRPEFKRMFSLVMNRENNIDAVVVYATSRFFRNATEAGVARELLKRYGVDVVSITQPISSDNAAGKFAVGLFGLIDELESNTIGERTSLGMMQNAKRGYFNGSQPPFGYQVVQKTIDGQPRRMLEVNEEEAEIVRRIFDTYLHGLDGRRVGVKRIAELLNSEDKLFRGRDWTKQRINERLSDPVYIGQHYYNRKHGRTQIEKPRSEWILVSVPPIIDEEDFSAVETLRISNRPDKTPPRTVNSPLLLSGLLVCGKCGANLTMEETGKGYRYYTCGTMLKKGKSACSGVRLPEKRIDQAILDHVAEGLVSQERLNTLIRSMYLKLREARAARAGEMDSLKAQLHECRSTITRYLHAFESGAMEPETVGNRLTQLRGDEADLEQRLENINKATQIPPYIYTQRFQKAFRDQLLSAFQNNDRGLAQRHLRLFLSQIVVEDGRIVVESQTGNLVAAAVTAEANGEFSEFRVLGEDWLPGRGALRITNT
jgi:site-specific DNA recombinase